MTSAENKLRMEHSIMAFNERKIDDFFANIASDCLFHEFPGAVTTTLSEQIERIPRIFQEFPDIQIVIDKIVAEDEHMVVHYHYQGTHQPTGKKVSWSGLSLLHVQNGQVVEDWGYADTLTLQQQLSF